MKRTEEEPKEKTKAEKAENRAGMPDNGEIEVVPEIEDSNKYLPTIESLHPDITRKLEAGDVRGALELFGVLKKRESPYYAELAQRLLDTGFTAKSRMISINTMEPLSMTQMLQKRSNNAPLLCAMLLCRSTPKISKQDCFQTLSLTICVTCLA